MKEKKVTPLESGRYAFALYDSTFKYLMADRDIALSFLRAVTKQNITAVHPVNTAIPNLKQKGYSQRYMDFACHCADGRIFVAEVQLEKHNNWQERSLFYPFGAYVNQLKKGDFWDKLYPVVAVNLLGFETGMIQEPEEYSTLFKLTNVTGKVVLPHIQILSIELPRVNLDKLPDGLLKGWLMLLIKSSEMKEIPAYFDETLRKAMKLLEWENWDSDMKKKYFGNKFNRDHYSDVIQETAMKAKSKIAQRMFGEQEPLDKIARFTGLTEAEILGLTRT